MKRKIFLSTLGTGNYNPVKYFINNFTSNEVKYVQLATLQYLKEQGEDIIDILLFVTDGAMKTHFESIKKELNNLGYSKVHPVQIPDGKTEDEIIMIFIKFYESTSKNDELYIDITHGFRPLPMLLMIFLNYAYVLKKANIKWISYGNFEARRNTTPPEAPIIDLTEYFYLMRWTNAIEKIKQGGYADEFERLSQPKYNEVLKRTRGQDEQAKILRNVSKFLKSYLDNLRFSRLNTIIESKNINNVKKSFNNLYSQENPDILPMFNHLINDLKEFILPLEKNSIFNGFYASKIALELGLIQQSFTMLTESMINLVIYLANREKDLYKDLYDFKYRQFITNILNSQNLTEQEQVEYRKLKVHETLLNRMIKIFKSFKDVRNDLNHAGMRDNAGKIEKIKDNIQNAITESFKLINEIKQ